MRPLLATLLLIGVGCFGDRARPGGPTEPSGSAILTARVLAPPTGATVLTGTDIVVRVEGRDLRTLYLEGVGFVARRMTAGGAVVDSAGVRFALRSDSTHEFTFQVPNTYPTNTQVDIYGIAFGVGGDTKLSDPVHVVVVQRAEGLE